MTRLTLATVEQNTPPPAAPAAKRGGEFVPLWLVVAVGVLLLAVLGVGAYVLFGVLPAGPRSAEPADIVEWRQRVSDQPGDVSALIGLGYAYQKSGEYKSAIGEYERALALDPNNIGALYNQGVSWRELRDEARAEESFRKVLLISPGHALASKALAQHFREEEDYESMLEVLPKAVEANPQMADLHALYGLALEKTGRNGEALTQYELAIRMDPDSPFAREGLRRLRKDNK